MCKSTKIIVDLGDRVESLVGTAELGTSIAACYGFAAGNRFEFNNVALPAGPEVCPDRSAVG